MPVGRRGQCPRALHEQPHRRWGRGDTRDGRAEGHLHDAAEGHLHDALTRGYDVRSFGRATGGDEVIRQLVLARLTEPVGKPDFLRVLKEAGVAPG